VIWLDVVSSGYVWWGAEFCFRQVRRNHLRATWFSRNECRKVKERLML
jgi:hypothetical protein